MKTKAQIMQSDSIKRTLKRISLEILEKNKGIKNLHLVGIKSRGVPMAERVSAIIQKESGIEVPVGVVDISLYRDDLSLINEDPVVRKSQFDFDINNANIVLFDDVLFTGRTIRAALGAIFANGRPSKIQLCVLIDRGHKELPIHSDYVGRDVPTSSKEIIKVSFVETDGEDAVRIMVK